MVGKLQAAFGNDIIQVSANKGEFTLRISDPELKSSALKKTAHTRQEMAEIIGTMQAALWGIRYELDAALGMFNGFDPDEPEGGAENDAV